MVEKLKKLIMEAKMIIATIALIFTSAVGTYHFASEFFVSKVYADKLVGKFEKQMYQLEQQTKALRRDVVETKMIRLETKIYRGEKLTPTEKRQYEKLKKQYNGDN